MKDKIVEKLRFAHLVNPVLISDGRGEYPDIYLMRVEDAEEIGEMIAQLYSAGEEQLEPEGEMYVNCAADEADGRVNLYDGDHILFVKKVPPPQQPSDSAGEEVYDVAISELDTNAVNWRGATVVLAEHFERVAENISDRITRPTVSEEEMLKKFLDYLGSEYYGGEILGNPPWEKYFVVKRFWNY